MNTSLTFGVMTDCQYADADNTSSIVPHTHHFNDNRYRLSPNKLQEAVGIFNTHELDFVIHLGDFIDRNLDEFAVPNAIAMQLKSPLIHVLGNHDFSGSEGKTDRVLAKFGLASSYFSQVIKGIRLIILDTNELGVIKYQEGSAQWQKGRQKLDELEKQGVLQAYPWNGGVGDEQLDWLEHELHEATERGEQAILFSHHPVFPPNPLNALDDVKILAVIDKYTDTVAAYINGHNHVGAYGERRGKPYITVPGILQGDTNAFGVITVTDSKIEIDGYDRMQDMVIERR